MVDCMSCLLRQLVLLFGRQGIPSQPQAFGRLPTLPPYPSLFLTGTLKEANQT